MTSKRYLVTLTPLGKYFFGGENTFVPAAKSAKNESRSNYFARSKPYPQQTTVLGMLRYAILLRLDSLNEKAVNQKHLIGAYGFKTNYEGAYGMLQTLSPVFLLEGDHINGKYWLEAGKDWQKYFVYNEAKDKVYEPTGSKPSLRAKQEKVMFSLLDSSPALLTIKKPTPNGAERFDPKETYGSYLKNYYNPEEYLSSDEFFKEATQVGVKKHYKHLQADEGFFKQTYFKLKEDVAFAFYVDAETEKGFDLSSLDGSFCPMGADGSEFRLAVKLIDENGKDVFKDIEERNQREKDSPVKITLLSDAMVDNSLFPHCRFAISDSKDFRHIETTVDTQKYHNIGKPIDTAKRSATKYHLLAAGSVLYPHNTTEVTKHLNKIPFRNIGYNHYIIESL